MSRVRLSPYFDEDEDEEVAFEYGLCIGQGSFGTVHMAKAKSIDKQFIVKKISKLANGSQEKTEAAFDKECKITVLAGRSCYIGESDTHYLMATEHLGYQINHFLTGFKPKSEPVLFFITLFMRLTHQVMKLHKNVKVIHQDLKLDNVVVQEDWHHPRLIDFGLAKAVDDKIAVAEGFVNYISPEVASVSANTALKANEKIDTFSLGVCFIDLLLLYTKGKELSQYFEGVSDDEKLKSRRENANEFSELISVAFQALDSSPPQYRKILSEVKEIIEKMVQKDPEARPALEMVYQKFCERRFQLEFQAYQPNQERLEKFYWHNKNSMTVFKKKQIDAVFEANGLATPSTKVVCRSDGWQKENIEIVRNFPSALSN